MAKKNVSEHKNTAKKKVTLWDRFRHNTGLRLLRKAGIRHAQQQHEAAEQQCALGRFDFHKILL